MKLRRFNLVFVVGDGASVVNVVFAVVFALVVATLGSILDSQNR